MKIFRKAGLILILLFGGIAATAFFFLTDSFIEEQLEKTLSVQNGALVEIDGFVYSIFDGDLKWSKLQVADPSNPMKNRFETSETEFNIQAWKLLKGKIIVDELKMGSVKVSTERLTDGTLPKDWIPDEEEVENKEPSPWVEDANESTKAAKKRISNELTQQPIFQLANTAINSDSIMNALELNSPRQIDSLINVINTDVKESEELVKKLNPEKKANDLYKDITSIDVNKIKDIKEAQKAIETVKNASKNITQIKNDINTSTKAINNSIKTVNSATSAPQKWINEDVKKVNQAAKLPDFDTQKIGELLIGPDLFSQVQQFLDYAATARKYLSYIPKKEKEEKPPRYKGQDIQFALDEPFPDMWVKTISTQLITGGQAYNFNLQNLTSSQKEINSVTDFNLSGERKEGEKIEVNGEFNYLSDVPKEVFKIDIPKLSLRTVSLPGSGSLPDGFERGNAAVLGTIDIIKGVPSISFQINATDADFKFNKKAKSKSERVFQDVMNSIHKFSINASIVSENGKTKTKIDSDIDNQVSRKIKAVAQGEINKVKRQLRQKVDNQVDAKKREFDNIVKEQEARLMKEKKRLDNALKKVEAEIKKKEKELKKKEEEIKNQATDKVKDLLKSKIKFK